MILEQNPHPIYLDLIKYPCTIKPSKMNTWFELNCAHHKLFIKMRRGAINLLDHKNSKLVAFLDVRFDSQNTESDLEKVFKKYLSFIKDSLDTKNIYTMNLILYQIIQNYPDIRNIYFDSIPRKKHLTFQDDNQRIYKIEDQDIYNNIYNFYFVDNLFLDRNIRIKERSNHDLVENFQKYNDLKKDLGINPKIVLI